MHFVWTKPKVIAHCVYGGVIAFELFGYFALGSDLTRAWHIGNHSETYVFIGYLTFCILAFVCASHSSPGYVAYLPPVLQDIGIGRGRRHRRRKGDNMNEEVRGVDETNAVNSPSLVVPSLSSSFSSRIRHDCRGDGPTGIAGRLLGKTRKGGYHRVGAENAEPFSGISHIVMKKSENTCDMTNESDSSSDSDVNIKDSEHSIDCSASSIELAALQSRPPPPPPLPHISDCSCPGPRAGTSLLPPSHLRSAARMLVDVMLYCVPRGLDEQHDHERVTHRILCSICQHRSLPDPPPPPPPPSPLPSLPVELEPPAGPPMPTAHHPLPPSTSPSSSSSSSSSVSSSSSSSSSSLSLNSTVASPSATSLLLGDPKDRRVAGGSRAAQRDGNEDVDVLDRSVCRVCRFRRPQRSKHCYDCKRCVLKFDHHCPFIANCVGAYNHRIFLVFITMHVVLLYWALLLALSTFDSPSMWMSSRYSSDPTTGQSSTSSSLSGSVSPLTPTKVASVRKEDSDESGGEGDRKLFRNLARFLMSTSMCLAMLLFSFVSTGLAVFHWYLALTGQTTYEIIKGSMEDIGLRRRDENDRQLSGVVGNRASGREDPASASSLERHASALEPAGGVHAGDVSEGNERGVESEDEAKFVLEAVGRLHWRHFWNFCRGALPRLHQRAQRVPLTTTQTRHRSQRVVK